MNLICLLSWMGLLVCANDTPAPIQTIGGYGDAVIINVLRIDETCTLYCDIQDLPPVIGKNMPVKIKGLKTADAVELNSKIRKFLNTLLLTKTDTPQSINLRNIQRGNTFCFLADIEIDGEDLCDLLVENGLAQRIIEVKEPTAQQSIPGTASQTNSQRAQKNSYIASKTSKIFHRTGCSHAKRIDPARSVYFSTRQEAIQSGRQPCKTCDP